MHFSFSLSLLCTVAVLSLIMKAVGGQDDLAGAFGNVAYLVVATVMAMLAQIVFCYIGLFAFLTRSNPITYLRFIVPAQTMAFACASSAATIPVTLKCLEATGRVPAAIAGFVIPLGATVNMDGGAIYFPCACIWLAVLNGVEVNFGHLILLVIISTIGSVGTAPVPVRFLLCYLLLRPCCSARPKSFADSYVSSLLLLPLFVVLLQQSASLVLIITAYNTVFNTTGTPDGFSFILAIDWFMDRLRTTMNVSGDAVVAGIVAHLCPLAEQQSVVLVPSAETSASVDHSADPEEELGA
jgi:Na+/H+-dicarboxylate symporter